MLRRLMLGAFLAASFVAAAQEQYPSKPIKLIVHTTPGAGSDVVARLVAEDMGRRLGAAFVVDNRPGAGGAIGVDAAAQAPADGYTLLAGASSVMVMLPALTKHKRNFDVDTDFVPIGRIAVAPFVLVTGTKGGFKTFAEVVAAAKAHPGTISYGSAGPATNPHLLGEMMSVITGADLVHVPYRGPGPAQVDLLGGNINLQFDIPSTTLPQIRAGKLKALAVTSTKRLPSMPDVPTVVELGYPQLVLEGWTALYARAGTPAPILAKLRAAFKVSMQSPAIWSALQTAGNEPDGLTGDAVAQDQIKSREAWRSLAAQRNISLD